MKKKVLFISISIFILLAVILTINSAPKEKVYLNKDNIEANKSLAIYIEQENGSYNKTTTFPRKEDGYTLNTSKSVCNGSTNISWDKELWGIELSNIDREETKCYLYFDIYVPPKASETILTKVTVNEGTPDFSKVATTDEGVFKVEDGMYGGTSYYWRGAVTNNYVKFANFCWRIIRINGDGSIRLIYDGTTCHANGESTTDSIIIARQAYNASNNRSEYVGYTYKEGLQRPEDNSTGTASNLKIQTDTWLNANIEETDLVKVANGRYCNDRNIKTGQNWATTGSSFYYAARERLENNRKPTLSCNEKDIYMLRAGAITADEVAYAGGAYGLTNQSYYLYNNNYYWTMTPSYYSNAAVFYVNGSSDPTAAYSLYYNNANWTTPGIRPVINLKSDTIFTEDGDGTQNNPYVVS